MIAGSTYLVAGGLVLGAIFGALALRTSFCVTGAITDVVLVRDWRRLRAWLLAIAVAIAGAQVAHEAGLVDLYRSVYLGPDNDWIEAAAGGVMFGFGMTLTGGCGQRTLVRLGAGSMKSLLAAAVFALFAYLTMRGMAPASGAGPVAPPGGIADLVTGGAAAVPVRRAVALLIAGALLWLALKDRAFRASARNLVAGAGIGFLVAAGWIWTVAAGAAPDSFSYAGTLGDGLGYLASLGRSTVAFGTAAAAGTIAGSFLAALASGGFRLEWFRSGEDLAHHVAGGALMGVGGVLALGDTIGQGITGMSTLALGSLVAWLAIMLGAVLGVKYLEAGGIHALFASRRGARSD